MENNPEYHKQAITLLDLAKNYALGFRKASFNDKWKLSQEIKFKFSLLQNFYSIAPDSLLDKISANIQKDFISWKEAKESINLSVKQIFADDEYKFITAKTTRMPIILERARDEFKEKIKTPEDLNIFLNSITQKQNIDDFELGKHWALGDSTVENGLMLSVHLCLEEELRQYPYIPIFLIDPSTSAIIHTIQIPEQTYLPENFKYSISISNSDNLNWYDGSTKTIIAVHNGYFFGGNRYSAFPDKIYAPQDCSSLLNLLLSNTNIITTKILSDIFTGSENQENQELFELFIKVEIDPLGLSVGDIVGWRTENSGHVGFVVEIDSEGKVHYLSLTRDLEEFNKEGYIIETLNLQDSDKDFFALQLKETYLSSLKDKNTIYESNLYDLENQHHSDETWLDQRLTLVSGDIEIKICVD